MALHRITIDAFEEHIGPLAGFHHDCHHASISMVQCDELWKSGQDRRVARGFTSGITGQHSWVVVSHDPYDLDAQVIDPTLWSYDEHVKGIWHGKAHERPHLPHGHGSIFEWGKPSSYGGEPVPLGGHDNLSVAAREFLRLLGPLDRRGWMQLANAPVGGWPATEIIAAMDDTPALTALVPIDRLGMLTDRLPDMYLP